MATQIVIYYVMVEPLYQQMTLLNQSKLSKISKADLERILDGPL